MTGRWRWPARIAALGYLALLIVVPVASVFFRAFQHGLGAAWDAVTTTEATHAFWLTVKVVGIAVPLDTVFGVGVALLLARRRFPGAWLLDAFIDIPLALSPVVVGLGLVLVYGKTGWFGNWLAARGIDVIFSVPGIIMASATVALPYVARAVLPVLIELGTEQEQAARTLGAGPIRVFLRITLPSIRRPLAYGVTLTTARVLGEFGAVAIVSGAIVDQTQTMTLFIDSSFANLDPIGAYAGAVVLALLRAGRAHHSGGRSGATKGTTMAITIRGVTKRYGNAVACDDVTLEIPAGSLTALLGPSGGGKSTLLRIIAGLETPDAGTVEIDGEDVTDVPVRNRGVGFCFQHYAPFRHLTVRRNVAFGLEIRRRPKNEIREKVDELLDLVKIGHLADRYPSQLSGGQRQRMALARALAIQPRVLLLDEPFGALDAQVRQELRRWLRDLHEKIAVTTVLVTHDQEEAMDVADKLAIINDGHLEQVGSPAEIYDKPANGFVFTFLGPATKLDGLWIRPHDLNLHQTRARPATREQWTASRTSVSRCASTSISTMARTPGCS